MQLSDRVDHVAEIVACDGENPARKVSHGRGMFVEDLLGVAGIDSHDRGHRNGTAQHTAAFAVLTDATRHGTRIGHIDTSARRTEKALLGFLEKRIVRIGPDAITVIIRPIDIAADDTFVIQITERQIVIYLIVAAADAGLMLHDRRIVVEELLLPVRALAQRRRVLVDRGQAAVHIHLIHHHSVFMGVEHVLRAPGALPSVGERVIDRRAALVALTGRDQNDAIRTAGTVNGSRRGVLEHFDRENVGRIKIVDIAADGHPIDNVERIAVVDGPHAADAYTNSGTGLAGALRDVHTRHHAFQHIVDASARHTSQVVALHAADGRRDDAFTLNAVTDHHHILQRLDIVLQDDLQRPARIGRESYLLFLIAYTGDLEPVGTDRQLQAETAVRGGGGSHCRELRQHDRCSGDRAFLFVDHDTLDFPRSGKSGNGSPGTEDGNLPSVDLVSQVGP